MGLGHKLEMDPKDLERVQRLLTASSSSNTVKQRCKILLDKTEGKSEATIARELELPKHTVSALIKRYTENGLKDVLEYTDRVFMNHDLKGSAKSWVVSLACSRPEDCGVHEAFWTYDSLSEYVRSHAVEEGFPELSKATHTGIKRILDTRNIKPHHYRYYNDRHAEVREVTIHPVLLMAMELEIQFGENGKLVPWSKEEGVARVVLHAEKRAQQPAETTGEEQPSEPAADKPNEKVPCPGTLWILAAIDVKTGEVDVLVRDAYTSKEVLDLLKILHKKYPKEHKIRMILDTNKVHSSVEVQEYVEGRPGRFRFVFAPRNAAWLNLTENYFIKITQLLLWGFKGNSTRAVSDRIRKGYVGLNSEPVVPHWCWNLGDPTEEEIADVNWD